MEVKSKTPPDEIVDSFKELCDRVILRDGFDAFIGGYSYEKVKVITPNPIFYEYYLSWKTQFITEIHHEPTLFECYLHGIAKASNEK